MNIYPKKYRDSAVRWLAMVVDVIWLTTFIFMVWCICMIIKWCSV